MAEAGQVIAGALTRVRNDGEKQPAGLAAVGSEAAPGRDGAAIGMTDVRFRWRRAGGFEVGIPSFRLARGEKLLLVGPSGSGKSTLLSLICGVIVPQSGSIAIDGTDITRLSGPARDRFRGDSFGIIFQLFNLVPYLSALDNVLLPLSFSPSRRARVKAGGGAAAEARRLLARLGLEPATFATKVAAELSVGQQQRVAAARALIGRPDIIVADEPTSSLDRDRQAAFLDLLLEETAAVRSSLLMVSHDPTLAGAFDRVVRIDEIVAPSSAADAEIRT